MDLQKLTKLLQDCALPVVAAGGLLAALVAVEANWLNLFGNPFEWSSKEWLFFAVAAIMLVVASAWSRRGQRSRLNDPDALRLDPKMPEQLVGRKDDLDKLVTALNTPLLFLVGESGSGKSALLLAGVMHDSTIRERFLPLYIDMSVQDWQTGPLIALREGFALALPKNDALRGRLNATSGAEQFCRVFAEFNDRELRRPLILLDQFDDFQARPVNRERFLPTATQVWVPPEEIAKGNAFWRVLRECLGARVIHVVVASRDDAADGLSSIALLPATLTFRLLRLETGHVRRLLDGLTARGTGVCPAILRPKNGWTALRDRLVDDLESRGHGSDGASQSILPQQMKVALRGLHLLPALTPAAYRDAGGLPGLEAGHVRKALQEARAVSGLEYSDLLRLVLLLVDRTRQPPDKAAPRGGADLAAMAKLDDAAAQRALESLQGAEILRPRTETGVSGTVWQLDHAYLARPLLRLERDEDYWRLLLSERARAFADASGSLVARWWALLPVRQQPGLVVARLRGRFRYGEHRAFAWLSLMRVAPSLFILGLLALPVWYYFENEQARRIESQLASVASFADGGYLKDDAAQAFQDLATADSLVRVRIEDDVFTRPQDARWFMGAPDMVVRAWVGLDADRAGMLARSYVTTSTLASDSDEVRAAAVALAREISSAPLDEMTTRTMLGKLREAMQGSHSRAQLAALGQAYAALAAKLLGTEQMLGTELDKLREAMQGSHSRAQLAALGQAYAALVAKLPGTEPRLGTELGKLREAMQGDSDSEQLAALEQAYAALAAKLPGTDPMLDTVMSKLREDVAGSTSIHSLSALGFTYMAHKAELSGTDLVLSAELGEAVQSDTDGGKLAALGQAYAALAAKLPGTDPMLGTVMSKLREVMQGSSDSGQLAALGQAYAALVAKLPGTDPTLGTVMVKLREVIQGSSDSEQLAALREAYAALAAKLPATDPVLGTELGELREAMQRVNDRDQLSALGQAYMVLTAKLSGTDPILGTELGKVREALQVDSDSEQLAALEQAYAALVAKLPGTEPMLSSERDKLRKAIQVSSGSDHLFALGQAYAALVAKLPGTDPMLGTVMNKLHSAMQGKFIVRGQVSALEQANLVLTAKLPGTDPLLGTVIDGLREAIQGSNDSDRLLPVLGQAYAALAAKLPGTDPMLSTVMGKLHVAMQGSSDSDKLSALGQAYAALAAKLPGRHAENFRILRDQLERLRSKKAFKGMATAIFTLLSADTGPDTWVESGRVVADLLLCPLSAGGASRELVDGYHDLLTHTQDASPLAPQWSGNVWAFSAWTHANLPQVPLAGAGRVVCHETESLCGE